MPVPSWPLQQAGPAQFDWLIHFCGRSPGASTTACVPAAIANQTPWQRLDNILWEQRLLGFPPFGAEAGLPVVSLSESPPAHLQWLLSTRRWPPWGIIFNRQYVYDVGGGPVWQVRTTQYMTLSLEQRQWAARFDTTPGNKSDWLHEREWRIPLAPGYAGVPLGTDNVVGILMGDPTWQPSQRSVDRGDLIDGRTGELIDPGNPYARPYIRPGLPPLWEATALRLYWEPNTQRISLASDTA